MIDYAPEALAHIRDLLAHYERLSRPEAATNLARVLTEASARIIREPLAGLPAPRPYAQLARPTVRWISVGRYWIAYRLTEPPVIASVFYVTADIPNRVP